MNTTASISTNSKAINLSLSFDDILKDLIIHTYDSEAIFQALKTEREGLKRKTVESALRRAMGDKKALDKAKILSSIKGAETRRRKRIVRSIYSNNSIWGMIEIRKIYPEYTHEMLAHDLKISKKDKPKKCKGYRYNQICKLFKMIKEDGYTGDQINRLSHLLARHCSNYRKPIVMDIIREGKTYSYQFPATIDERKMKAFIQAISNGDSIDELQSLYVKTRYNTSGLDK